MPLRRVTIATAVLAILVTSVGLFEWPSDAAVTPKSVAADDFLDSIGVGTHWEYRDSVYGLHTAELIADLRTLGVRHVRGYDPLISRELARYGIDSMLVAGPEAGSPARIAETVAAANASGSVISAVEGPNEPDLFWPRFHYSYNGQDFPAGVVAYQRDLYQSLKSRPDTANVSVIGPSLGKTYNPPDAPNPFQPASMTKSVDFGNFHPYPFGGNSFSQPFFYGTIQKYYWSGNFPSVNLDEFPYAREVYSPPFAPRPMVATETGYPTFAAGVSEAVQAKYIPRLFAEYFRLGVQRTWLYELVDIGPDPSGTEMDRHFGLLRHDLTPKPAFVALRALLALIGSGIRSEPGPPAAVTLTPKMPPGFDRTAYVHSLMLRQSPTQNLLLIWHEVASTDTSASPPRSIDVPPGTVDVAVEPTFVAKAWYAFDEHWSLKAHPFPPNSNRAVVPLKDEIVAISLERTQP